MKIFVSRNKEIEDLAEKHELKNALIESTALGCFDDRAIFSSWLYLDYGGSGQGFGGYALDGAYNKETKERASTRYAGEWIQQILNTVGAGNWEDLQGKHIRVICDHCKVYAIGHYMKDKWFVPEWIFEKMRKEDEAND